VDLSGFQTVRYGESRLFSKKEVVVHSANYQRVIESPHFPICFLQTCWLGTSASPGSPGARCRTRGFQHLRDKLGFVIPVELIGYSNPICFFVLT
jgi:hypothetical protein